MEIRQIESIILDAYRVPKVEIDARAECTKLSLRSKTQNKSPSIWPFVGYNKGCIAGRFESVNLWNMNLNINRWIHLTDDVYYIVHRDMWATLLSQLGYPIHTIDGHISCSAAMNSARIHQRNTVVIQKIKIEKESNGRHGTSWNGLRLWGSSCRNIPWNDTQKKTTTCSTPFVSTLVHPPRLIWISWRFVKFTHGATCVKKEVCSI
jgi:hypothetical protein